MVQKNSGQNWGHRSEQLLPKIIVLNPEKLKKETKNNGSSELFLIYVLAIQHGQAYSF